MATAKTQIIFLSHTRAAQRRQQTPAVRTQFATTVVAVSYTVHSVCARSLLCPLPVVVAAVDAVCWLAACLFRLSDTDTFAALAHSALCVLCVLFDGLAVHSFVRLLRLCLCYSVCVCVSASATAAAAAARRFGLLCLLWLCVAVAVAVAFACLVQLLQLNFSSVFYRRRSQYILFSVPQCSQCSVQCEADF